MKSKSIKELLELMLNNQQYFKYGLCSWVYRLYDDNLIDDNHLEILLNYIDDNKPRRFVYFHRWSRTHYWKPGKIKPRIKWIEKHINKLS